MVGLRKWHPPAIFYFLIVGRACSSCLEPGPPCGRRCFDFFFGSRSTPNAATPNLWPSVVRGTHHRERNFLGQLFRARVKKYVINQKRALLVHGVKPEPPCGRQCFDSLPPDRAVPPTINLGPSIARGTHRRERNFQGKSQRGMRPTKKGCF